MSTDIDMQTTRRLEFSPVQSYQQFVRDGDNNVPGVYVLGFCFEDGKGGSKSFMPYYVGKHEISVQGRVRTHHETIRNGTSAIFRKEFIGSYKGEPLPMSASESDPDRMAYRHESLSKGEPRRTKSDLSAEEMITLQPHIDYCLDNLYITFVPVDESGTLDKVLSKNFLERIEWEVKHDLIGSANVLGKNMSNPDVVKSIPVEFLANHTELGHIFKGPGESRVRNGSSNGQH